DGLRGTSPDIHQHERYPRCFCDWVAFHWQRIHDDDGLLTNTKIGIHRSNMHHRNGLLFAALTIVFSLTLAGAVAKDLKPGFNLFSAQQDIEVGRDAAA